MVSTHASGRQRRATTRSNTFNRCDTRALEGDTSAPTLTDQTGAPTCLVVEVDVLRRVGPARAVVHAVIASLAPQNEALQVRQAEIARCAGLSVKTTRRAIAVLEAKGLIALETRIGAYGQKPNAYRVVGTDQRQEWPIGAGQCDHPYWDEEREDDRIEVVSSSAIASRDRESCTSKPSTGRDERSGSGVGHAPPESPTRHESGTAQSREHLWSAQWPSADTPMPVDSARTAFGGKTLLGLSKEALWLAAYFEARILTRTNAERSEKGLRPTQSVGDARRAKFFQAARKLLVGHDLAEVINVIDKLFDAWSGRLPFDPLPTQLPGWRKWNERRVTNLRQILENYEQLLVVCRHASANPDCPSASSSGGGRRRFDRKLDDAETEAKVEDLVRLFTIFRTSVPYADRNIAPARARAWAKTFRIMLCHRLIPHGDIVFVIEALTKYAAEMDVSRYLEAYDLVRNAREWECVRANAGLAALRNERRAS